MLLAALVATAAGLAGAWELMQGQFAAGAALLALSVALLRWPQSIWTAPDAEPPSAATRRLGILVVWAAAAFFRLYQLNPPGLWGDDAINGLLAFDILDGRVKSPFALVSHSHSDFHALSNYPIAAAFWLFGPDLTTLRLPGILLGIAGAPLLCGVSARGGAVRFEVVDQGPGIPPARREGIFERFTQGGEAPGAAGLGLSIAEEIVTAHGGTIGVESTPGAGSTFWFTLPGERA